MLVTHARPHGPLVGRPAQVLKRGIKDIEGLTPGDKPPLGSLNEVFPEYEARRMEQPKEIQMEISNQLKIFDAQKVCPPTGPRLIPWDPA